MSLNITNLNSYNNYSSKTNAQSIDVQAAKELKSQLLGEQTTQSVDLDSLNLSKFNRVDLGLDLYNASAQQATQVAVRNSGLDVNLNQNFLANVQYLNSQAAVNAHQTTKQVDGKIVVPVSENDQISLREVYALPKAAELFEAQNLDKDKRGSNPFSYQKTSEKKENNSNEPLSIFA